MSDRDALFQTILDAPDDDAPRLVFADWLDEHGESDRAEFIRVQCEKARLPFYERRYAALARRAEILLAPRRRKWRLPRLAAHQVFRRGFVEQITLNADLFITRSGELFAQAPIRRVGFTRFYNHANWDWRLVDCLEGLDLSGGGPHQRDGMLLPRLRWLKGSAHFLTMVACPRLTTLDLSGRWTAPSQILGSLQQIGQLRCTLEGLVLDSSADQDYTARLRGNAARILATGGLTNLRRLHVRHQAVGDAGLSYLSQTPELDKLEELYLDHNEIGLIGPTGIEDLCSSTNLGELRVLSLAGNPLGLPAVQELAAWPGLARLRWLDLSDCGLGPAEVRPLARSQYLHPGLGLQLDGNNFPPSSLFSADMLRPAAGSVS